MSYDSRRCFATFGEQDGPPDAKTGDAGEQFRMSERQRVRGTAVDSYFCESRGNRVAKTWRLPQHKKSAIRPFPSRGGRAYAACRKSAHHPSVPNTPWAATIAARRTGPLQDKDGPQSARHPLRLPGPPAS